MDVWNREKNLHVDAVITEKLGAALAWGTPEGLCHWREELGIGDDTRGKR